VNLRTKLLLAQLPLAISLLVVGAVSRQAVDALDHSSQDILKDNYLSVLAAQRMRDSVDALGRAALGHAHGRKAADAAELPRQRATFERELAFQEGNITEVGEREVTQGARAAWSLFQRELAAVLAAPPESAEGLYFQTLAPRLLTLEAVATTIMAINQDAMVRKSDHARSRAKLMSSLLLGVSIAAFVLGILSSIYLTHRLTRPLAVLTQAVRRLGQGDLAARARLPGHDEIAQVAEEFNTMAGRLADYRRSSLGELLAAQQSSQAAIDSLPDPVLVLQTTGELLNANQAAETSFGVNMEATGHAIFDRTPLDVLPIIRKMKEHIAAGKGAYVPKGLDEAVPIQVREGTRYFLARANPVLGEAGQTVGLTILFQDVTRLRRFDEFKTDMVATVAHEFRTPLTSLRMAIHLLSEGIVGPLAGKQAELVFAAREDLERLQAIVDDLLDLSRIQAGRIELHQRMVAASTLLEQALEQHRPLARKLGLELAMAPGTIDRLVAADPSRVQLVLGNLIANAVRHTPSGGRVALGAVLAEEANFVRFEVLDTGAGIGAEFLPRLFERFFQIPGSATGGAGLGLYICKEVIEAHGGQVGVDSTVGQGTRFWFTLPTDSGLSPDACAPPPDAPGS
jgi:signal transduction histidine kinase/HAMP domain-containing protein